MAGHQSAIKSIAVGFKVLRPILDADRPLSLRIISLQSGIDSPRAHKYLASFCRIGLARQDPESGEYGLGSLALEIGTRALAQLDVTKIGRERINDLMRQIDCTTALCAWNNAGPVVVDVSIPASALFAGLRLGARLPVWASATGRVFLAFIPELECDRPADSDAILQDIRTRGFAVVRDSVMRGMSGASAPVYDHTGRVNFAVTILGPFAEEIEVATDKLCETARLLSRDLGYAST